VSDADRPKDDRLGEQFDPNDSPFDCPPTAGLPFGKNSGEARAIKRVLEAAERRRSRKDSAPEDVPDLDDSPFDCPPTAGLPFGNDSAEAHAIRRILEAAERRRKLKASPPPD
jgi:hypothetical protein